MNNELKKMIDSGESGTVEFKTSFGRETIESLDALSVLSSGILMFQAWLEETHKSKN